MNRYYVVYHRETGNEYDAVVYPRDDESEYSVYVCADKETEQRFLALYGAAEKISRKRAVYLGWSRPRRAEKTGDEPVGKFVNGSHYRPQSCEEAIDIADETTRRWFR